MRWLNTLKSWQTHWQTITLPQMRDAWHTGSYYQINRRAQAIVAQIKQETDTLIYFGDEYSPLLCKVVFPNDSAPDLRCCVAITDQYIVLYSLASATVHEVFRCSVDDIVGFWRPEKYEYGNNVIWIHLYTRKTWRILHITCWREEMMNLVRALKQVVDEDIVTAYRRRRPYIHRGLSIAYPATQDIHGAWQLGDPVHLYLMPLYLVVLGDEQQVDRMIPIRQVQNIGAFRRLDTPEGVDQGLVRFAVVEHEADDERFAFAIDDYQAWAEDLAESAKRTLEDPILQKRKGKDDEDE